MEAQVSKTSASPPSRPARRTISLPVRRPAALAAVLLLPLTLAACGLVGGDDDRGNSPIVIPSETTDTATPSGSSVTPGTLAAAAAPAPLPSTVTKTGLVVRRETRTQVRTATKTLPQVTLTPAPITLTETQTQTQTQTQTLISVLPAKTVTKATGKTVTKTATKTATRTVTRTQTRTVTKKA